MVRGVTKAGLCPHLLGTSVHVWESCCQKLSLLGSRGGRELAGSLISLLGEEGVSGILCGSSMLGEEGLSGMLSVSSW